MTLKTDTRRDNRQNRKLALFDFTTCGGRDARRFNVANLGLFAVDKVPAGLFVDWQAEPLTDEAMCGGLPEDELIG